MPLHTVAIGMKIFSFTLIITGFIRDINKLYEEIDRSNETFIKHYKRTYTQPPNPPAWMSLEVASMGLLSKLLKT